LGQDVLNVGDIMQRAAEGLRALGYRRIVFCLVDPKNQRVEGVLDASDDPSVNLAKVTSWPLEGEYVNVHQKVIREGKSEIVEDGWSHPLTDKDAVAAGGLGAFAVIPLLDYSDSAIGTILVERQDQSAPSQDEVQNFLQFGQQLAAVIEQGERVNLMQCSLDQIPEPLLIFDTMRRVRYANRTASELLPVAAGWKSKSEGPPLPEAEDFSINADRVLEGHRSFRNFVGLGRDKHYRGALLSAPILDWRQRVVGALAHIGDLNYVFQAFLAFENAAKASDMESLLQALLQGVSRSGHKWGRIYLVEGEGKSKSLVSKLAFGSVEKDDLAKLSWQTGAPSWLCLDRQKPVIFFRDQESEALANMKDPEPILVSERNFPSFAEKPGSYWVDFPLVTLGRALGKITIEINRDYTPEHHEFLKVLCEMGSGLLEAFLRRERDTERKEGRIRAEAAHLSLAHFSHNIATRFANLDPMIERYRGLENDCPQLKDINGQLEQGYRGILSVVNEAKHKLQVVHPDLRHVNAIAYFKREMTRLAGESLSLDASSPAVWMRADENLLTGALSEIVQNARDAANDPKSLCIHAGVNTVEHGGREFVQFVIEDNGPGVEDSNKERIFEDFFTHHPGREPGTGLGLSLVRRVFEAHRGWVRENGVYGRGARFELEIPKVMTHATELEN
jgi:signal transduction histidine kinase